MKAPTMMGRRRWLPALCVGVVMLAGCSANDEHAASPQAGAAPSAAASSMAASRTGAPDTTASAAASTVMPPRFEAQRQVPAGVTATSASTAAYLRTLSEHKDDHAEPLDTTAFNPPKPDHTEPEPVS